MKSVRMASIVLAAISFLSLSLQTGAAVYADGDEVEYWAVIVGIADYLSYGIDDLDYSDDSALNLYTQLAPVFGTDHVNLLIGRDAYKADIQNAVQGWLAPQEQPGDVVLIYFAGHGGEAPGGYTICPYDTDPYSYSNDIFDYELNGWLSALDTENIIVIIESCHSGGFIPDLSPVSRVIMASSTASQSSWETSGLQSPVFSYFLVQALDDADISDVNADFVLTTREIFDYLSPKVVQYMAQFAESQNPVDYDSYAGGLPLFMIARIISNIPSAAITIDGAGYIDAGAVLLLPNSSHQIAAQSEIADGNYTRYVFSSWGDGYDVEERTISQGGQYFVNYDTQYRLNIQSIPDAVQSSLPPAAWYDAGTTASTGAAEQTVYDGDTRYVFQSWIVDGALRAENPVSVSMDSFHTAIANYKTQYLFDVQTEHGSISGSDWYDSGALASTGTAEETVDDGDTRYVFQHWDIDGITRTGNPATIYMYKSHIAEASYQTQYRLDVLSQYGEVYGAGWYDSGAVALVSVEPVVGTLIRHRFTGWDGDSTDDEADTSVYMDQPKVLVAAWETDYLYLGLLIGGVIGIAALAVVSLVVRGKGQMRGKRPVRRQKRYAR